MDAAESAAVGGLPAFALARPPGHHASSGVAMGESLCIISREEETGVGASNVAAADSIGMELLYG